MRIIEFMLHIILILALPAAPPSLSRNLFYENPHERLFQGEGHLALYNNLFINRRGDGLIVLRHNHVPKNISILHNTVVTAGFGIRIDQPDRDYQQRVAGNLVWGVCQR